MNKKPPWEKQFFLFQRNLGNLGNQFFMKLGTGLSAASFVLKKNNNNLILVCFIYNICLGYCAMAMGGPRCNPPRE